MGWYVITATIFMAVGAAIFWFGYCAGFDAGRDRDR